MDQPDAAGGTTSMFYGEDPGHQACERP